MAEDRPPRMRLFDILDCIRQIEVNVAGVDHVALGQNVLLYRAVERWLEIISEASRHIDATMKAREASIDWKQIANFGNVVRHGYQSVDQRIVWNIVTYDLPELKAAVTRLYAGTKFPADPWPDAEPK